MILILKELLPFVTVVITLISGVVSALVFRKEAHRVHDVREKQRTLRDSPIVEDFKESTEFASSSRNANDRDEG